MEYDPEATADENFKTMTDAKERVRVGRDHPRGARVARAMSARSPRATGLVSATTPSGSSRRRWPTPHAALLDKLVTDTHEIVTLIEGEGATAAHTRHISEWVGEHRPAAGVEVHHGGQPLYPYLFSVE